MSHEDNLFDLYAGLAMLGLIMRGDPVDELADEAFRYAEDMIAVRNKLPEGGIAAIHKPKRKYERKT
jgi:hypothetical protein